eukprot:CAMPEP_0113581080 /NCGR_PEP_ID=MMETSP0015_2-20120614/31063_1 /TAXON_ID=2838 /ORGANISM="Odontella" /LENGTH=173 /DNA_ID=CAMNT_0000485407 /DNA_START=174 /DNA_END=695 /DNA_ORIENTATION=- /assembly_acc=CAM_ASM_000160
MRCPMCQRSVSLENETMDIISAFVEACIKRSDDRAEILTCFGTMMVRKNERHVLFQGEHFGPRELYVKALRINPLHITACINLSMIWPNGIPTFLLRDPASGRSVPKTRLDIIGRAYLLARDNASVIGLLIDALEEDAFLVEGTDSQGEYHSITVTRPRLEAELYELHRPSGG